MIATTAIFILLFTPKIQSEDTKPVKTDDNHLIDAGIMPVSELFNCPSLADNVLQYALKGQAYLQEKNQLINDSIITIVDFSKPSKEKRLYIIDVKNTKLLLQTYVAHGKNTGLQYAKKFSNIKHSLQSSLGFYKTSETYQGKHGYSLRIDGLEKGRNDKARERAIVIHGANYVSEKYIQKYGRLGRSFGCPALSYEISKEVIDLIKNGSCLFLYHPSLSYSNDTSIKLN
ncbi:hypothetical protein DMA11_04800 [Marinilabiliaceae bacterium JC017]|nr:hypothetical protein DMA11_04800 [Marinilabiliaceae bacterium JC017]